MRRCCLVTTHVCLRPLRTATRRFFLLILEPRCSMLFPASWTSQYMRLLLSSCGLFWMRIYRNRRRTTLIYFSSTWTVVVFARICRQKAVCPRSKRQTLRGKCCWGSATFTLKASRTVTLRCFFHKTNDQRCSSSRKLFESDPCLLPHARLFR